MCAFEETSLLAQIALRTTPLGDIHHDTDDPQGLTLYVALDLGLRPHPVDAAVGVQHSVFRGRARARTERFRGMPRDLVAVVGVDRPEEELRIAGLGSLVAEAEDAAGL